MKNLANASHTLKVLDILYPALSFLLFLAPIPSFAQPPPGSPLGDLPVPRDSMDPNWLPGESIDLRTGSLSWEVSLITLPGPAGLGIEVSLSKSKFSKPRDWGSYRMAGNWQLEVPRVRTAGVGGRVGTFSNNHTAEENSCNYPYYLAAIALSEPGTFGYWIGNVGVNFLEAGVSARRSFLYNTEGIYPSSQKYASADNWLANCSTPGGSGFTVHSAAGLTYTLDVFGMEEGQGAVAGLDFADADDSELVFYASKVEDLHGNSITYNYSIENHNEGPESGGAGTPVTMPLLTSISSSDGRLVEFEYDTGTVKKLKHIKQNNREWDIEYDSNGDLEKIVLPDDSEYVFTYTSATGHLLHTATLPQGAMISYTYEDLLPSFFGDFGSYYINAVSTRSVTGPNLDPLNISIDYQDNGASNRTVISGDIEQEIDFFQDGPKHGHPKSYSISDSGTLLQSATLDWEVGPKIGNPVVWVSQQYQNRYSTPKWQKSLSYDSGAAATTFSNFDSYGNPHVVTEAGTGTRITNRTYKNVVSSPSNWIVGLLEDETVTGGGVIDRTINSLGLLTSINEYGISETYEYHGSGDLHKKKWTPIQGGTELVIEYLDYKLGKAREERYPDSALVTREVDDSGNIEWERDGENNLTSYEYDDLNRLKRVELPEQSPTITTWLNPNTKEVKRGSFREITAYDGLGREVSKRTYDQTDASDSIYVLTQYDDLGRMKFRSQESSSSNETTGMEYKYDALNRVKEIKNNANNAVSSYNYWITTGSNRQYGHTLNNFNNFDTDFFFDVYGRPTGLELARIEQQVIGTDVIETEIDWTKLGDISEVRQGGFTRTYNYHTDKPRLLHTLTQPEIGVITYTYDNAGNKKSEKIGTLSATTYDYDEMNRLTDIDYPGGTNDVELGYFKTGDVMFVDNGISRWDYLYTGNSQIRSETLTYDAKTFNLTYDYDNHGNLEEIIYPSSKAVDLNPDAMGRPTSVDTYAVNIDYHPNGRPSTYDLGNGVEVEIGLNNRQFVRDLSAVSLSGNSIFSLEYFYDDESNVARIIDHVDSGNERVMTYDGANRLDTVSILSGFPIDYDYDDVGNITALHSPFGTTNYIYGATNNRLLSTNAGASYTYNGRGNIVGNGAQTFTFNAANQLAAVPTNGVSFRYDGNGHRILANRNSIGKGKSYFVYSKSGVLMHEFHTLSNESKDHIYLHGQLIASDTTCSNSDTDGDLLPDCIELDLGFDINDAEDAGQDVDGDGVSTLYEYVMGTSPNVSDTDGDGISDGYEHYNGLEPSENDAHSDLDNDNEDNIEEYTLGTDANKRDTDGDGAFDNSDSNPLYNPAWVVLVDQLVLF